MIISSFAVVCDRVFHTSKRHGSIYRQIFNLFFRLDVIVIVVMGHFVHRVHLNAHVAFVTSVSKLSRKKKLRCYEKYNKSHSQYVYNAD